jgi:hypothetical protein
MSSPGGPSSQDVRPVADPTQPFRDRSARHHARGRAPSGPVEELRSIARAIDDPAEARRVRRSGARRARRFTRLGPRSGCVAIQRHVEGGRARRLIGRRRGPSSLRGHRGRRLRRRRASAHPAPERDPDRPPLVERPARAAVHVLARIGRAADRRWRAPRDQPGRARGSCWTLAERDGVVILPAAAWRAGRLRRETARDSRPRSRRWFLPGIG